MNKLTNYYLKISTTMSSQNEEQIKASIIEILYFLMASATYAMDLFNS